MGQPVVHFEVMGKDGDRLRGYYSELFGWEIDANNPMNYGTIQREEHERPWHRNRRRDRADSGYDGHVTFYVEVPDVEAALAQAESLGGARMMGPDVVTEGVEIGLFNDPEGHVVGVVKTGS